MFVSRDYAQTIGKMHASDFQSDAGVFLLSLINFFFFFKLCDFRALKLQTISETFGTFCHLLEDDYILGLGPGQHTVVIY